jgi:UDP-N-acetylglucosamine 2-epimerase (non-hydrolysing)
MSVLTINHSGATDTSRNHQDGPVINELRSYPSVQLLLINTAQHYDYAMSGQFLASIGEPDISLSAGKRSRSDCIGVIVSDLGATLRHYRPDALLVHGDTNTTMASAIAANAEDVFLAHVEAGLRSYDRAMPEEHNRVVTDHLADLCFAPTTTNRDNLVREAIPLDRIRVVGNTIVEAVQSQLPSVSRQHEILTEYRLTPNEYLLATIHRPENTDDPVKLAQIFQAFNDSTIPVGWSEPSSPNG